MLDHSTTQAHVVRIVRWAARLAGAVFALALILFAALGSWDFARMSVQDLMGLGLLVVAIIALVLSWFWEPGGGALLLAVAVANLGIELGKGVVDGGSFVFAILGAAFISCWWVSRPHLRTA